MSVFYGLVHSPGFFFCALQRIYIFRCVFVKCLHTAVYRLYFPVKHRFIVHLFFIADQPQHQPFQVTEHRI